MSASNSTSDAADKRILLNYLASFGAILSLVCMLLTIGLNKTFNTSDECSRVYGHDIYTPVECEPASTAPPFLVGLVSVLFLVAILLAIIGSISAICSIFWLRKNPTSEKPRVKKSIISAFVSAVLATGFWFLTYFVIVPAL